MASTAPLDITAPPAANQNIFHEGKEYTTVKEGLAYILIPASASKTPQTTPKGNNEPQSVFYNPIQQFNRDLSVLAIKAYGEQYLETAVIKREKFNAKQKNKKRKRGDDLANGDSARKAGRLEEAALKATDELAHAEPLQQPEDATAEQPTRNELDTTVDGGESQAIQQCAESIIGEKSEDPAAEPPSGECQKQDLSEKKPPKFKILDALSATGLRALRYAQEIPFTTSVIANDLLAQATKSIELNVKHNRLEDKITANTANAASHMYSFVGDDDWNHLRGQQARASTKYNVIDLDPYGTAAPFLDAAVQSVVDGGLLCVTCTDAGVWASNGYPEKAFSLYGGTPIKGMLSHEGGLRLILHAIASSAARYGLAMEPLLSLSIDFYARVFVRIHKSAADVKFLSGKTMVVYNCDSGCGAWNTQMVGRNKIQTGKSGQPYWKHIFAQGPVASENCSHCGMKTHMAGPMYAGPLHSPDFIQKILDGLPQLSADTYHTLPRIEGMLTLAMEECLEDTKTDSPTSPSKTKKSYDPAAVDPAPFLFIPSALAKVIHCVTPVENSFRGALRGLGYRVTRSHTKPGSIKTDAPWDVIWEVMRQWTVQKEPVKSGAIREGTAGYQIMKSIIEPKDEKATHVTIGEKSDGAGPESEKIEIVFNERLGADKSSKKVVRYQLNPRENWGPMARAKGN